MGQRAAGMTSSAGRNRWERGCAGEPQFPFLSTACRVAQKGAKRVSGQGRCSPHCLDLSDGNSDNNHGRRAISLLNLQTTGHRQSTRVITAVLEGDLGDSQAQAGGVRVSSAKVAAGSKRLQ